MAIIYKILGQVNPTANTDTDLYTVPLASSAVTSTLIICNQSTSDGTYKLAARIGGESISAKNYLVYDGNIPANDSLTLTLGMSLSANDVITCNTSSSNFSVTLFGSEF